MKRSALLRLEFEPDAEPYPEGLDRCMRDVLALVAEDAGLDIAVNVLFLTAERIRELNREFRDVDRATDVLSFPAADFPGRLSRYVAQGGELETTEDGFAEIGDIAVCTEIAGQQAAEIGHSSLRECVFLILHGALHLIGYDHITEDEEEEMTEKQRAILETSGMVDLP